MRKVLRNVYENSEIVIKFNCGHKKRELLTDAAKKKRTEYSRPSNT